VATFSCSAGYNLVVRPKLKEVLRRLDHAAIFLMIAGTYTPFILIKMNTPWGLGLLAVVWTMAGIGIVIKLFAPRFLGGLSTALYLVQGWAVIAAWEPLMSAMPGRVLTLLVIGGVLYTVGVVFHLWERLPYQNAIWHGFVLSAASCHFAAVIVVVGL
jgi:hemolysin III